MFQFCAALEGPGQEHMLVCVLEESDLPKLGDGRMLTVKPHFPAGEDYRIVMTGIYFTRQTQEVFMDEMRKGGVAQGIVMVDNRSKPGPFATPYNQGVKARADMGAVLGIDDPERICPYLSGQWRENWVLGWKAEDQRLMNDSVKGRLHDRATE